MEKIISSSWDVIVDIIIKNHPVYALSIKTFVKPLSVYFEDSETVTFFTNENKQIVKLIKDKFSLFIEEAITEVTGKKYKVDYITKENTAEYDNQKKKEDIIKEKSISANIKNDYTFETFIVGPNNTFAHAASLAVSEAPGEVYNPLFIYGGVGLGKTHLMHSIAHNILEHDVTKKVLYVTSENFTNELIESIRGGGSNSSTPSEFREKYRNIDVLLIDDIQFIIGKESTQEEFFHTFNELYQSKKQIIISSDKPPKEFSNLEERLRSRFEMGLIADIQLPTYETRMAILRKKGETESLTIDDEVLHYIAENVKSNIRELEGALNKITAFATLFKREINLSLAEEALKDIISPNAKSEITVEFIIDVVAEHFSITKEDILSKKRTQNLTYPRQICMYLSKKLTSYTLAEIGSKLGKKDHTTVMHGADKIAKDLENEEKIGKTELLDKINILIKKLSP